MRFASFITEEYLDLVKDHFGKKFYPVYKNPDSSEFKDLAKQSGSLIRFVLTENDMYVSPLELLHAMTIKKYNLRNKWLFRGSGMIVWNNKINIGDLRTNDMEIVQNPHKWPWIKYFKDWDRELSFCELDASIL